MGLYKVKYNPFSKTLQWVYDGGLVTFKDPVVNESALPSSGNTKGDARFTDDTNNLYIWDGSQWINQGTNLTFTWDSIDGKPSSTPTQIDDTVNKAVVSEASGDYKKVTQIQYNPSTGDLKIEYEN